MSLDPNIILQGSEMLTRNQPDILGSMAKAYALKQEQLKTQGMMRLRDLASNVDPTTEEGQKALVQGQAATGDISGAINSQYTLARSAEQRALAAKNLQLTMQSIGEGSRKHIADSAQRAGAAANVALGDSDPNNQKAALAAIGQQTIADAQPRDADDSGTTQAKLHLNQQWGQILQRLPQMSPQEVQFILGQTYKSGMTFADMMTMQKRDETAQSPIAKIRADQKKGLISDADAAAMIRKETTIQPNMATVMVQQAAANADPSQPLPRNEEMAARAIADGAPLQPVGMRNPRGNAINARAQQLFAEANNGDMSGFGTLHGTLSKGRGSFSPGGVNGQTLIALDTAVHHFDALGKTVDALGNGDLRALNAAGNYLTTQFGDPKVTNFETVKSLAADEFAKVAAGTSTGEQERAKMQQLFSSANSPAQLKQAIQQAKILMAGKVQGLNQQYKSVSGGKPITDRVSPETQQVLSGMGVDLGGNGSASSVKVGDIPKKSDGTILPDGDYHGFSVKNGKVSAVEGG